MLNRKSTASVLVLAVVLTGVWYLLSGKFDLLHFGTGVITALLIAASVTPWQDRTDFRPGRFVLYVPWLIGQILISNLRVARLVLSWRMPIAPTFISQPPGVKGARALTMLGSSVTLTPGTLTVDVGEDEMFIHALDTSSANDIKNYVVAKRVAEVFPERPS
jgi:multicomponent Na+:H+ antiporter subunit E